MIVVGGHNLARTRPARFVQKFLDDRALTLASLVAWGILNTFLPLLLGIVALVGLVFGRLAAASAVEETLVAMLPAAMGTLVQDILGSVEQVAGVAGLVSLGLLLFNGSNLFVTFESVFDIAYHVPERHIITQRLVSFAGLLVLTGVVLLASGVAALDGAFGAAVESALPRLKPAIDASVANVISAIGLFGVFVLLYWLLPNANNSLRQSLPGAFVAATLFLVIVHVFPLYVSLFGNGFSVYAAFGTVLLFMFWLYIVGVVIVAGAELNAFLVEPERSAAVASLAARALTGQLELPPTPTTPAPDEVSR
jgi:membrane protein